MNAIGKLKQDTARFCDDNGYDYSFLGILRLYFIIDYWPVLVFRLLEFLEDRKGFLYLLKIPLVLIRPIINGLSGSRIYSGCKIGPGLLLHQSSGVVIASEVTLGENCTIFSGACIVNRADGQGLGGPIVGDNVKFFAGCKVVGNVKIGDNASVAANAVVIRDVPSGKTAVGIPSKNLD